MFDSSKIINRDINYDTFIDKKAQKILIDRQNKDYEDQKKGLKLNVRNDYFNFRDQLPVNPDTFLHRRKGFFWDNYYHIVDEIFINPYKEKIVAPNEESAYSERFVGIFENIPTRKKKEVETIFLKNVLTYEPLARDIHFMRDVDSRFFNLKDNKEFKKLVETNLDFIRYSNKSI